MHKHTSVQFQRKLRPFKVVAKRKQECMVVTNKDNFDCEWIDDEELDLTDVAETITSASADADIFPVINADQHLQNPWTED